MTDFERLKQGLKEQANRAPDVATVRANIEATLVRRHARIRAAWIGASALAVVAVVTIPILIVGDHQDRLTTEQAAAVSSAAPAVSHAARQSSSPAPSTPDFPTHPRVAPSQPTTSPAGTGRSSTRPSSSVRSTHLQPAGPTVTSPAAKKLASAWKPSANPLDPKNLPPGLMPAGWTPYGMDGKTLVYGVTPTRDDSAAVAKLSVTTWTGDGTATCAGLPAKIVDVDDGSHTYIGARSYVMMKIDERRAYVLDLPQPNFDKLTSAQGEVFKSIYLEICGDSAASNQGPPPPPPA